MWLDNQDSKGPSEDDADEEETPKVEIKKPQEVQAKPMPENYESNKKKFEAYIQKNVKDVQEEFKQRIVEDYTIPIQEMFSFFASSFHIQGKERLMFLENADDEKDYFSNPSNGQKIFKLCHDYLIDRRGLSVDNFDIKDILLGYKDCLDIIDYWFSSSQGVLVLSDSEFNIRKAMKSGVLATFKGTITKYEEMLKSSNSNLDKKMLISAINELKQRVAELEGNTLGSPKGDKGEKKMNALKEIYYYYARQHVRYGVHATFDSINREHHILNLGEFAFIVKDFELLRNKSDKSKIAEVFKKCSVNNQELELIDFKRAIERLALTYYDGDNKYGADIEKIEAFYDYMGLSDGSYREKMSDRRLAFHSKEKMSYRIPNSYQGYQHQISPNQGRVPTEMMGEPERRKLQRETERYKKLSLDISQNRSIIGNNSITARRNNTLNSEASYTAIQHKKVLHALHQPDKNKISLQKLERYNYDDIKDLDENFDPNDLIDENDPEDTVYLAEYDLQKDRMLRQEARSLERKRLEQYGIMRSPKHKKLRSLMGVPTSTRNYPNIESNQMPDSSKSRIISGNTSNSYLFPYFISS